MLNCKLKVNKLISWLNQGIQEIIQVELHISNLARISVFQVVLNSLISIPGGIHLKQKKSKINEIFGYLFEQQTKRK